MYGGAIISDFIPPPRSRRVTSEFLWPDLKKSAKKRSSFFDLDDEFEADFQGFKDDSSIDCDDAKPFVFAGARKPAVSAATAGKSASVIIHSFKVRVKFFFLVVLTLRCKHLRLVSYNESCV